MMVINLFIDSMFIRLLWSLSFSKRKLSFCDSILTSDDVAVPLLSLFIRDAKLSMGANKGSPYTKTFMI